MTIYYVSGTGNSFRAASWLFDAVSAEGSAVQLLPVDKATATRTPEAGPRQLVALYHPAHGLMPPWSMIKFLLFQLPRGNGRHGAVVTTRGGIPISKLIIPGGGGLALYFPLLILLLKGYRIRGALGLDMPCNLLNVHWGITAKNTQMMLSRARTHHTRFVAALADGRPAFRFFNMLWELLFCIPFVFYPLLPILYLTISRVFMAKLMFTDSACKHCGACARHCPREAIKMTGAPRTQIPFWTWRCEACMRCMAFCRHRSIQASHLWAFFLGWGTSFVSAEILTRQSVALLPGMPDWVISQMQVVSWMLAFILIIAAYYLFFGLLKIPPLRLLFSYTTLTRFYHRRYHEPETRAKEMVNGRTGSVKTED